MVDKAPSLKGYALSLLMNASDLKWLCTTRSAIKKSKPAGKAVWTMEIDINVVFSFCALRALCVSSLSHYFVMTRVN